MQDVRDVRCICPGKTGKKWDLQFGWVTVTSAPGPSPTDKVNTCTKSDVLRGRQTGCLTIMFQLETLLRERNLGSGAPLQSQPSSSTSRIQRQVQSSCSYRCSWLPRSPWRNHHPWPAVGTVKMNVGCLQLVTPCKEALTLPSAGLTGSLKSSAASREPGSGTLLEGCSTVSRAQTTIACSSSMWVQMMLEGGMWEESKKATKLWEHKWKTLEPRLSSLSFYQIEKRGKPGKYA